MLLAIAPLGQPPRKYPCPKRHRCVHRESPRKTRGKPLNPRTRTNSLVNVMIAEDIVPIEGLDVGEVVGLRVRKVQ